MNYLRSLEVVNPSEMGHAPITVIGAGAIGSRVFAGLVELGFLNITVWDFDVVESHNLPNQLFGTCDIGSPKVEALKTWLTFKTGEVHPSYQFKNEKFQPGTQTEGLVFLCVDSLSARKEITAMHKDFWGTIVDSRLGSSFGDVYAFKFEDSVQFYKTLEVDPDLIETSACGGSISVSPSASIIANLAVWQGVKALKGNSPEFHVKGFIDPIVSFQAVA